MAGMMKVQPFRSSTFTGKRVAVQQAACRSAAPRPQIVCRSLEAGVGLFGTKAGMTQLFTADGAAGRPQARRGCGGGCVAGGSGPPVRRVVVACWRCWQRAAGCGWDRHAGPLCATSPGAQALQAGVLW